MNDEELPSLDDMPDKIADVDVLRKDCAKWRAKYVMAMIELDAIHAAVDYAEKAGVVVAIAKQCVAHPQWDGSLDDGKLAAALVVLDE